MYLQPYLSGMQCACAILSSVAFLFLHYLFPHYLINYTIFEKKTCNIKCVFWLSLQRLSEIFVILRRSGRDMIKNAYPSSCKVPLFLSDFNVTWIFWTEFPKILKYQILWKSVQRKTSYYMRTNRQTDIQTDGQTDMTKIIFPFRNFAYIPKNRFYSGKF